MTYTERVHHYLSGIEPVSAGACPGCKDCGLEDLAHADDDPDRYDDARTGHHSRYACEVCRALPGERYPAHGTLDGDTVHLTVCVDCYMYLANGDVPDGEH